MSRTTARPRDSQPGSAAPDSGALTLEEAFTPLELAFFRQGEAMCAAHQEQWKRHLANGGRPSQSWENLTNPEAA